MTIIYRDGNVDFKQKYTFITEMFRSSPISVQLFSLLGVLS